MKVLSVASECVPLVKTGGLADVVGALPSALAAEGVQMKVLLPGYPAVMDSISNTREVLHDPNLFGGSARLLECHAAGLDLLVLDAPHLYYRPGTIYLQPDGRDWPDNPERFAALSWIGARIGAGALEDWQPDVIHMHDWQAGLCPVYLDDMIAPGMRRPGTVMSVHNIAFQGLAPMSRQVALRLPADGAHPDGYEYYGQINALKAGLMQADRLTTVSPTYARELMRPEFGMGLEGVLQRRSDALTGILNGIDTGVWNPMDDPFVHTHYGAPEDKGPNKDALRAEFGLPEASGPLCIVVSRLTEQKGLDLLLAALPALLQRGGQLALLGTGSAAVENEWREAAARNSGLSVHIGYDEAKAHRMMAGADAILVPSRFEPCGLTQLYALRYGTVPVVALTGGLADTVIPASPAALNAGVATGIQVYPLSADSLAVSLGDLVRLFEDEPTWQKIRRNAMDQQVGWDRAAKAYAALFTELVTDAA